MHCATKSALLQKLSELQGSVGHHHAIQLAKSTGKGSGLTSPIDPVLRTSRTAAIGPDASSVLNTAPRPGAPQAIIKVSSPDVLFDMAADPYKSQSSQVSPLL